MSHHDALIPTKDDEKNSNYTLVVPYINDFATKYGLRPLHRLW